LRPPIKLVILRIAKLLGQLQVYWIRWFFYPRAASDVLTWPNDQSAINLQKLAVFAPDPII